MQAKGPVQQKQRGCAAAAREFSACCPERDTARGRGTLRSPGSEEWGLQAQPLTAPEEGSPNLAEMKPAVFLTFGHSHTFIFTL